MGLVCSTEAPPREEVLPVLLSQQSAAKRRADIEALCTFRSQVARRLPYSYPLWRYRFFESAEAVKCDVALSPPLTIPQERQDRNAQRRSDLSRPEPPVAQPDANVAQVGVATEHRDRSFEALFNGQSLVFERSI